MSQGAGAPARRRWPWIVGALVVAALVFADHRGLLLVPRSDDLATYQGVRARVLRVLDGDTIEIDIRDAVARTPFTRVRLWGVDCPETAKPDRAAEPWAQEARQLTRSAIAGGPVTLHLEPHRTRGTFGRVLAHVQPAEGPSLAEALLESGFAATDERWPHALLGHYAQLQNAARRAGVGVWSKQGTDARRH